MVESATSVGGGMETRRHRSGEKLSGGERDKRVGPVGSGQYNRNLI
jgi:hypothetical protein